MQLSKKLSKLISNNPWIATAGCYFQPNIRVAYFVNLPWGSGQLAIGDTISIIVLNGNCAVYVCNGGTCVNEGDLSMRITEIRREVNDPFAKLTLTGTAI
jgi:hypothetical protein